MTQLDLVGQGIGTVLWATGFKPDHSWVDLPVLDYKGRIQHDGGVLTGSPGAYLLGASLLRRRRSTYIDGAAPGHGGAGGAPGGVPRPRASAGRVAPRSDA